MKVEFDDSLEYKDFTRWQSDNPNGHQDEAILEGGNKLGNGGDPTEYRDHTILKSCGIVEHCKITIGHSDGISRISDCFLFNTVLF